MGQWDVHSLAFDYRSYSMPIYLNIKLLKRDQLCQIIGLVHSLFKRLLELSPNNKNDKI